MIKQDNKIESFSIYTSPIDGSIKVNARIEDETIWLTPKAIAKLFNKDYSNILKHIKNIYDTCELSKNTTMANFATVVNRGFRGAVEEDAVFYNLDIIIAVGYRVNSIQATHFRIWATKILKEYIIKGFALNDDKLKEKDNNYFDELLERIRDIRSTEKLFYRKILEIYATSRDYDSKASTTQNFFATVQNKIHFSVHGHTASELIYERVDSDKPFVGLTVWNGSDPKKKDVSVAKNYLKEDEIKILNRIVTMYLEFAELQAITKTSMYMKDWISKLDDFLKLSGREILKNKGRIKSKLAKEKANLEFDKYKEKTKNGLSEVEKHFLKTLEKNIKKLKK